MLAWLATPEGWAALAMLTAMEIVLGLDNVVSIAALVSRLPPAQAELARRLGLLLAMAVRIALLVGIMAIMAPPPAGGTGALGWREVLLFAGGAFLVFKAAQELHMLVEPGKAVAAPAPRPRGFTLAFLQIAVVDLAYSVDSVALAVGIVDELPIMIAAVLISTAVMLVAAGPVSRFIASHPGLQALALAFLLVAGVLLIAEGAGHHVPREYVYWAGGLGAVIAAANIAISRGQARLLARRTPPLP
jgi:predicted tellurium resistance membrane protein TerC